MDAAPDVSEEQLDRWLAVFNMFDKHGDANISTDDLGHVVRGLDRMPTEGLLQTMIEEVDTDGNGSVDVDEFVQLMLKHPAEERSEEEVASALGALAQGGNGAIRLADLRHYLTQWGERLSEEEVWELEKMLHPDGNERVPIADVVDILCHPPGPSEVDQE